MENFHSATAAWFNSQFEAPTEIQTLAWDALHKRQHTLIAAPTGSGKTLAAFLTAINSLIQSGLNQPLNDTTRILYVSPLKALSNDIQKNLQAPLCGIRTKLLEQGLADLDIRAAVRTGDTPQSDRARMRREPPHILVTTPESLYIMLTAVSGRVMLANIETVIIDEIHALAGNKRGTHLMLSLERLEALCGTSPIRIGLSATQKPLSEMARYLVGNRDVDCTIVNRGHTRERDLAIEVPSSPLDAVMANEIWNEIYSRLTRHIQLHKTTLIFVNTRRLAERVAKALSERLGETLVNAHHGSLSREHRLSVEQQLKSGKLRALVATASLELGIDIGDIELVCQIGSPRSISAFLQRVGRSGHGLNKLPKGRLYPLTRDDLIECLALLDAVAQEELDTIRPPSAALDVLAQQIIAEVASREWDEQELFECFRRARPFQHLLFCDYTAVLRMLADGFTFKRGRRNAYLHWDRLQKKLRPRSGARLVAITNGGAIPDQFDYDVMLQPEGLFLGTLNEDFAFESMPGDIFQLGNTSYRMLKIEKGRVYVEDARGQAPNLPFWIGEAPGRSNELSIAVSQLRQTIASYLREGTDKTALWLVEQYKLSFAAAKQVADYLGNAQATFDAVPTQTNIIIERFFDETGATHLVIHSPYGARVNRAWGLALRKRFCKKFNFELQAAALDDTILLSLATTHSFVLSDVVDYLNSKTVRELLRQAVLTAPMFTTRWRWVANISLALPRYRYGKKVPAAFQRNDSEDMIALIFPDQIACQENIVGPRDIPDHPLVTQTLNDCLQELMDIDGLEQLLRSIESGAIKVICKDLTHPSVLAQEILNARPYAFLDDAPAEERRALAVQQRRFLDPETSALLAHLDANAIAKVRSEVWPLARTPDEMYDTLMLLGYITSTDFNRQAPDGVEYNAAQQGPQWSSLLRQLNIDRRAVLLTTQQQTQLWVAMERLHEFLAVLPAAEINLITLPLTDPATINIEDAVREIMRSRLEFAGPISARELNDALQLDPSVIQTALLSLEQQGFVLQGHYEENVTEVQWCERGLLARIHRYTLKQLRREIEPVSPAQFMQFLFHWQQLDEPREGLESLAQVLRQLQAYPIAAAAWERDILPRRLNNYNRSDLDQLCRAGRFVWFRSLFFTNHADVRCSTFSNTPISIIPRQLQRAYCMPETILQELVPQLSSTGQKLYAQLQRGGASFASDLAVATKLLPAQLEQGLAELVANGLATADSFSGLRALISPNKKLKGRRGERRVHCNAIEDAGRWSLISALGADEDTGLAHERVQQIAHCLLLRYGVVFRKLLEREPGLPSWRKLLSALRLLEARGEARGGRFVNGFSGEQFALPEAVSSLREIRRSGSTTEHIVIAATDPLNFTGILTPGERIHNNTNSYILFHKGVPVAANRNGDLHNLNHNEDVDLSLIRGLLSHPRKLPLARYDEFGR